MKTYNQNLLNIVIPTKNRSETIKFSIKTILQQNYRNLRIIISDNNSKDGTRELVEGFDDNRLKYYFHTEDISMRENWEFGLSKAEDGFVTIMGDDDGFCPNSFFKINEIINKNNYNVINWTTTSYFWPISAAENNSSANIRFYKNNIQEIKSKVKIKNILEMNEIYSDGPMIYNSFLSVDLIKSIKKKQGNVFFLNGIPDMSSLYSILLNTNIYCRINLPIGVAGASKKSNGSIFKNNNNSFNEVKKNLSMFNIYQNIVPSFYFTTIYPYKDFMKVYPSFSNNHPINYFKLIARVMDELKTYDEKNYKEFYRSFCNFLKVEFSRLSFIKKIKIFFINLKIERVDYYFSKNMSFDKYKEQNILTASKLISDIYRAQSNERNENFLIKFLKHIGLYGIIYFLKNFFIIMKVLRDKNEAR